MIELDDIPRLTAYLKDFKIYLQKMGYADSSIYNLRRYAQKILLCSLSADTISKMNSYHSRRLYMNTFYRMKDFERR